MRKKTFVVRDTLLREVEKLSKEKNASQSKVVNTLIELGLKKQQALELAQETKLDKLSIELAGKLAEGEANRKQTTGAEGGRRQVLRSS